MDYFWEDCDKALKTKSEGNYLQSLTDKEFEKCVQKKHTQSKILTSLI